LKRKITNVHRDLFEIFQKCFKDIVKMLDNLERSRRSNIYKMASWYERL